MAKDKVICLYSGGLDSTTVLYYALKKGWEVIALTIAYGQRHQKEIEIAKSHAKELSIEHHNLTLTFPWKGSSLLDLEMEMPLNRSEKDMSDIPNTYVPARNLLFLSYAASCAETMAAGRIMIGVNALDYSGYPDCRPQFIEQFTQTLKVGTKAGAEGRDVIIDTPLIQMSKKEIVELGVKLGVPFEKTWSCYLGGEEPCGKCDSCYLRAKGFDEAGTIDRLVKK